MSIHQRTKAERRALMMRIKEIQRQDPELIIKYIAERFGVSGSYIYTILKEFKRRA